ncbi:ArsR/SmtB family transcription factor [Flaviflexus equikiangi]|uniref:ArsR/SmtB family transcription factor n=1 Tax=Flaviflexus equikiangi TaxID=2758573 RepID=UPI0015F3B4D2|nr:helix-turn-helix domain-containing protein [Flaviflexus equikiangi]
MTEMSRLKTLSHPLRLQILVLLDAMKEGRTSDLASELGAAANKVSYHLSILESGGLINRRVGEDARETWWSVNEEKLNPPEPDPSERGSEEGRAASFAILEYLRSLVPDLMDKDQDQSVMLGVVYLTSDQRKRLVEQMGEMYQQVRELSSTNYENGEGDLYALGAQLLPARPDQR